jgi:hypothetical protein
MNNYDKIFNEKGLFVNRMISHSKSYYRRLFPYNKVYFNANIFIYENEVPINIEHNNYNFPVLIEINNFSKKIWFGDIDITTEGYLLKEISKKINKKIYVLTEHDGRWGNEEKQIDLENKAIWNTDQEIIEITKEYIEEQEKLKEENNRLSRINRIKTLRNKINLNKKIPLSDLKKDFLFHIDIPIQYIESEVIKFKEIFNSLKKNKNIHRERGFLYNEYFKEYGYFSYGILEKYLKNFLNINKDFDKIIDPSSVWMSRKLNKKLRKIDLEIERLFNKNFKYSDFKRYVTCNYCVPYIDYTEYNLNSFKDNVLYLKENYSKKII